MSNEKLTPEDLLQVLNVVYGYCVIEKKKSIFNTMIKLYQYLGINKEKIGIILCTYLRDIVEEMANGEKE